MMGHERLHRPTLRVRLGESLRKLPGRMHFVRVTLARESGQLVARSTGNQGSGLLRSMAAAQGLLIFPAESSELHAGDEATVQILDDHFFAEDTPGY